VCERKIGVDRAKIEVIEQLPPSINVRGIRSFLHHASFYRRFIKYFSYIARPLTNLLGKDVPFEFDDACLKSFNILKKALISTPIIQPLIGLCLLKSCVMLVIILWGQFCDKQKTKSIMQLLMVAKL
jgi:hypothetical protein